MLATSDLYASAEVAYRQQRIAADIAASSRHARRGNDGPDSDRGVVTRTLRRLRLQPTSSA
jgi:hypothetical protein